MRDADEYDIRSRDSLPDAVSAGVGKRLRLPLFCHGSDTHGFTDGDCRATYTNEHCRPA
jgi:hypothetical protein